MKKILLVLGLAICMASCATEQQEVNPAPDQAVSQAVAATPYLELPMTPIVINGQIEIWLRNPGNLHYSWEVTAVPSTVTSYSDFSLGYHAQYDSSTLANDNMRTFMARKAGWYEVSLFDFNGNRVAAVGFNVLASMPPYLAAAAQTTASGVMYFELPTVPMVVNESFYIWLRNAPKAYHWQVDVSPDPSPRSYSLSMPANYDEDSTNIANIRAEFLGKVAGFYMITLYEINTGVPVLATGFTVNP